ncbi:hypothetical protein DB32_008768 [Sandaracinus amylolyticus]|uniref:Uncharacterized protein n=1 Tax=Sandaracinus amylolyticus TaxID=927083 RepID=A0A0F6SI58_9BACT|nr:hypothetical protein DB32_008768 [Sandaracinus amylolyticus]
MFDERHRACIWGKRCSKRNGPYRRFVAPSSARAIRRRRRCR